MAARRTTDVAWRRAAGLAVVVLALAGAGPAAAQGGCAPSGASGQCNEFGSLVVPRDAQVDGQSVELRAGITVNQLYQGQDTRSIMFSVRNVSTDRGPSLATVQVVRFATAAGDVAVWKVETAGANEVNLWVDVLDLPVGQPIELVAQVGATGKGVFNLEVLVMPFDRAFHPVYMADGQQASLFASTVVAAHSAAGGAAGGGVFADRSVGKLLPGFEPWLAAAAVGGALLLAGARPPRMFRRP